MIARAFQVHLIVLALCVSSCASPVALAAGGARLGQMCGGLAGVVCDHGLFCEMKAGQCKTADGAGRCVAVPRACPRLFMPVCGCNDRTYANDCERQVARVSKAYDGKCR